MNKIKTLHVDTLNGKVYNSVGQEIGFGDGAGYIKIGFYVKGSWRRIKRSHIIWWAHNGQWPEAMLDHKNRTKNDDRIDNLRLSNDILNGINKDAVKKDSMLPKHVGYDPGTNKKRPYKVEIKYSSKRQFIGRYATLEEASLAAQLAHDVRVETYKDKE